MGEDYYLLEARPAHSHYLKYATSGKVQVDPAREEQSSDPLTCWMSQSTALGLSIKNSLAHTPKKRSASNQITGKNVFV